MWNFRIHLNFLRQNTRELQCFEVFYFHSSFPSWQRKSCTQKYFLGWVLLMWTMSIYLPHQQIDCPAILNKSRETCHECKAKYVCLSWFCNKINFYFRYYVIKVHFLCNFIQNPFLTSVKMSLCVLHAFTFLLQFAIL